MRCKDELAALRATDRARCAARSDGRDRRRPAHQRPRRLRRASRTAFGAAPDGRRVRVPGPDGADRFRRRQGHRRAAAPAYRTGDLHLPARRGDPRSEEHTSELQSLMRISYAVFCLKKKNKNKHQTHNITTIATTLKDETNHTNA